VAVVAVYGVAESCHVTCCRCSVIRSQRRILFAPDPEIYRSVFNRCYKLLRRTNCLVLAAVIVNDHTVWITCKGTVMINTTRFISAEKCQTLPKGQTMTHTNVIITHQLSNFYYYYDYCYCYHHIIKLTYLSVCGHCNL